MTTDRSGEGTPMVDALAAKGADYGLAKSWSELWELARSLERALSAAKAERVAVEDFARCVGNLVNGSGFDLQDSPKSMVATLQRLVRELEEARAYAKTLAEGK